MFLQRCRRFLEPCGAVRLLSDRREVTVDRREQQDGQRRDQYERTKCGGTQPWPFGPPFGCHMDPLAEQRDDEIGDGHGSEAAQRHLRRHRPTALISAIQNAETEILLTNAYFAPDPQLLDALKSAVRRGVDVKLILPSKTDSELIFCELMNRIADRKWKNLGDVDPVELRRWLLEFGELGTLNTVLTDGRCTSQFNAT